MADEPKPADPKPESMFNDTQKGLAWFITIAFVLLIFVWVFFPPTMKPESMAQLNNLVTTLVTLVVMAFGYFLGSNRQSKDKDDTSNKIMEKLTGQPPAGGPVAPVPQSVVVVAWWSLLTDAEKAAINEAAKTDAKIQALIAVFAAGKAEPEHLAALVTAGLLTKERAETFKTA